MDFAVRVYRFCRTLPRTDETRDIARQLRKASSSVAANYRSICRARSNADFAAKFSVVIEEADECGFWLEFLVRVEIVDKAAVKWLTGEANELVAIFTAGKKTARARLKSR